MKFILSKVVWWVSNPGNILFLLFGVGVVLLWTGRRKLGHHLLTFTFALAVALTVLPLGNWMVVPLENRFPTNPPLPERVDGIIALGGVVDQFVTEARGQPSLGGGIERITEMMKLGNRYPEARLIFTGGSGDLTRQNLKEAMVVRRLLRDLGFDSRRVEFEENSRNTYENAVYTREMAKPKEGETWLLITSAFHMPRSVGVFRSVGWEVVPYPVDYITEGDYRFSPGFDFAAGLGGLGFGLHEWLGLVAYRIMGRSSEIFPGPLTKR